jgi:hypothetical protein
MYCILEVVSKYFQNILKNTALKTNTFNQQKSSKKVLYILKNNITKGESCPVADECFYSRMHSGQVIHTTMLCLFDEFMVSEKETIRGNKL